MQSIPNSMASFPNPNYHALFLFIVFVISAFAVLRRRRWNLPITKWPFQGMLPDLILNSNRLHDYITHVLKLSHATFMFKGPWLTNIDMVFTSDPANIRHILTKNFRNYPKGPEFRNMFDILGDGIFNSDDEQWEIHRKATMSLFKHPDFQTLVETTTKNKVEKGLLPFLHLVSSRQEETDLHEILQRFSFDATCMLLLDHDPKSLSVDLPFIPCQKAFTDAEEALFWRHVFPVKVWRFMKMLGLGMEKKLSEASKDFDEFIYKSLPLQKEEDKFKFSSISLLTRGLQVEPIGLNASRKFIKDAILSLMVAGKDSTSATLSWFFYLLAQNLIVEQKIRDEIKSQLGGRKWKSLGPKDYGEMVYLHGGICEALRLYPQIALEHKSPIIEDILPSGHSVDAHSMIILSFYSMGRMEEIWGEDCMEFRPERWISGDGKIKNESSYKFTAFHAGPRTCLGKEIGLIQMKMMASAVIYHYHVELVEGHNVCASNSILLHMKHGLKIKLFPVNNIN